MTIDRDRKAPGGDAHQPGRDYERALNPALHGCETFDFAPDDLPDLRERLRACPAFSVHAPLPTPPQYPGRAVTSFLLDPDLVKRQASLDMLHQTIGVAGRWGAKHVVVHFGGVHSDGLSEEEVTRLVEDTAAELCARAGACGVPLHIEYAAYNPRFARPEDLLRTITRYPDLYVCLDVGHLRIGAQMLGIDEWEALRILAPHTRSMHLWTTRGRDDVRRYHHVPVHPSLTAEDGWIDIPRALEQVLAYNPDCAIVFEPNHLYNPDRDWQAEGMDWVRQLVG